jgi:Na+/proline symporter
MVVVIGLFSLGLALFAATIYKLAIFAWTVLLVGQVAPFVLGIYWKKANQKGALWGYLAGFVGWLVCMFVFYQTTMPANPGDLETALWDAAYMGSVPGFFISLLVLVGVSIFTQKSDPPKPMLDVDDQPLRLTKRLGWLKPKDVF